jgi:hypothetical protein
MKRSIQANEKRRYHDPLPAASSRRGSTFARSKLDPASKPPQNCFILSEAQGCEGSAVVIQVEA